jgi:hypothetical protein
MINGLFNEVRQHVPQGEHVSFHMAVWNRPGGKIDVEFTIWDGVRLFCGASLGEALSKLREHYAPKVECGIEYMEELINEACPPSPKT